MRKFSIMTQLSIDGFYAGVGDRWETINCDSVGAERLNLELTSTKVFDNRAITASYRRQ